MLERKLRQSRAPSNSERRCYVEKTLDAFLYLLREDPVEILGVADRHHVEPDPELFAGSRDGLHRERVRGHRLRLACGMASVKISSALAAGHKQSVADLL